MTTIDNNKEEKYSEVFYENALCSINKVINHFETTPNAFTDLSVAELKSIRMVTEGGMIQVLNPNYILSKYCHEFNKYNFKTKHIISPFSSVVANYETHSECEINLTEEGLLKTVRFSESVKTLTDFKLFWVIYSLNFKVEEILRSCLDIRNGSFQGININSKSYCESIESESYFLGLFLRGADTKLLDILPEYSLPSAYDFSSDEFNIRLKVAEMLLI
jgi:hypothetical protein